MNFFNISEVWGSVKESVKDKFSKSKASSLALEATFITPSIIALGKLTAHNVDELLQTTQDQPSVLWNISGAALAPAICAKLQNQIIDITWKTPGHLTQAPFLDFLLLLCQSIKSWFDLKDDHTALIYCGNSSKVRKAILISCLLKYLGASKESIASFSYYSSMVNSEAPPILSPSYRTLFSNFDAVVNQRGYPNKGPLHLKSLAIKGLPVDDIPCVEIWSTRGLLYNSYDGNLSGGRCDWVEEYGDAYFLIDCDIVGDFLVLCRFGGEHATNRDISTLLFKYQNSTAFLPPEVLTLQETDIDMNHDYTDGFEWEGFSVILIFEPVVMLKVNSSDSTTAGSASSTATSTTGSGMIPTGYVPVTNSCSPSVYGSNGSSGKAGRVLSDPATGKEAFEKGLDEISRHHIVMPEPSQHTEMTALGLPNNYIGVALQLSNNNIGEASNLTQRMIQVSEKLRLAATYIPRMPAVIYPLGGAADLTNINGNSTSGSINNANGEVVGISVTSLIFNNTLLNAKLHNSPGMPNFRPLPGTLPGSYVTTAPGNVVQNQLKLNSGSDIGPLCTVTNGRLNHKAVNDNSNCMKSSTDSIETMITVGTTVTDDTDSISPEIATTVTNTIDNNSNNNNNSGSSTLCPICNVDSYTKREQLVSCSSCSRHFHTYCFGGRKIPFTLINSKERTNRDKYIKKYYSGWKCAGCITSSVAAESPAPVVSTVAANKNTIESDASVNNNGTPSYITGNITINASISINAISDHGGGGSQGAAPPPSSVHDLLTAFRPSGNLAYSNSTTSSSDISTPNTSGHSLSLSLSSSLSSSSHTPNSIPPVLPTAEQVTPPAPIPDKQPQPQPQDQLMFLKSLLAAQGFSIDQLTAMNEQQQRDVVASATATTAGKSSASSIPPATATASSSTSPTPTPVPTPASALDAATSSPAASTLPEGEAEGGGERKDEPVDNMKKYHNMIKFGVPKQSVAAKMVAESLAASLDVAMAMLDGSSTAAATTASQISDSKTDSKGDAKNDSTTTTTTITTNIEEKIMLKDHPLLSKYFRMIKVGMPKESVTTKMKNDNFDTKLLDRDPEELISSTLDVQLNKDTAVEVPAVLEVAIQDHPKYSKYFKMLKVGLPKDAVKAKMLQEQLDPKKLDWKPTDMIPMEDPVEKTAAVELVALQDHPVYSKYFKMLKVGLPVESVRAKMRQESIDPAVLDRPGSERVPLEAPSTSPVKPATRAATPPVVKKNPIRKKRLHWKALDASKLSADSLWNDKDEAEDILLDEAEFRSLFEESGDKKEEIVKPKVAEKKQKVILIDAKRAQNAGIALARLKMTFKVVREKIARMEDESFSTEQLRSLEEYLPNADEIRVLSSYQGDLEMLGQAEKYMHEMKSFPSAAKRIQYLLYKRQFTARVQEVQGMISKIGDASNDVRNSIRLKKVLRTILKVGNQMNDGEEHLGFTVDSLLKLQSAKAFDKKTTILQYVVTLVSRNDPSCLLFPEDMGNLAEASRISIDSITAEKMELMRGLETCAKIADDIEGSMQEEIQKERDGRGVGGVEDPLDKYREERLGVTGMRAFLEEARGTCDELDRNTVTMKDHFACVLTYFGEDPNMSSQDFFSTLDKFVKAFAVTREAVERQQKIEKRKAVQSLPKPTGLNKSISNSNFSSLLKNSNNNANNSSNNSSNIYDTSSASDTAAMTNNAINGMIRRSHTLSEKVLGNDDGSLLYSRNSSSSDGTNSPPSCHTPLNHLLSSQKNAALPPQTITPKRGKSSSSLLS